ncbi:MAG: xanthine dehydrogenase family protein subunit M [Acidimicrobiia bacterium]
MKPAPFRYERPTDLDTALQLLAADPDGARVLAGGQSLLALMNMRLARPETLVDLNEIAELQQIERRGDVLEIGALVRQRVAERNPDVRAALPLLVEAIELIGHATIRNRGTVGGSIAHADPASELPAAAVALDAELVVRSASGTRTIPAAEFFTGPFSTAMEPGEVLVAVRFDLTRAPRRAAVVEHARRSGDFAVAGAVCGLDVGADGVVHSARVVGVGLDAYPRRASDVEATLAGGTARAAAELDTDTLATIEAAAAQLAARCAPTSDIHGSADYRRRVGAEMFRRAVRRCLTTPNGKE